MSLIGITQHTHTRTRTHTHTHIHTQMKRSQVRKGMVMVDPSVNPTACWEFEGDILVLHHPTTISPKYQAMGEWVGEGLVSVCGRFCVHRTPTLCCNCHHSVGVCTIQITYFAVNFLP